MNDTETGNPKIEKVPDLEYKNGRYTIYVPKPTSYLYHEPTRLQFDVHSRIGWFRRLMLRWCFGLKYFEKK